jgi:hypothetical protein
MPGRSFSQLTAPAKQLLRRQTMAPSYGTDRLPTRYSLRDNPRLGFIAPLPSTTSTSEDFQPPDRLRGSTTHCVHSKPYGQNQAADSQISTSSGRWPQNIAYVVPIVRASPTPAPENADVAETWFAENDPEGVAFEYQVLE